MSAPRCDGLYVCPDSDGFSVLRFFEDGTVLTASVGMAERMKNVLEWLTPTPPTKSRQSGFVPAPWTLEGERIQWTSQLAWTQCRYEGSCSVEQLILERTPERGEQGVRRYDFFSAETIQTTKQKLTHPPAESPASPPLVPPSDASGSAGYFWHRVVTGETSAPLKDDDILEFRTTTWTPSGTTKTFGVGFVRNLVGASAIGDVVRTWITKSNGDVHVADTTYARKVERPAHPRSDGLFVGPEVDGMCLVVRLLDQGELEPLRAAVTRVARSNLYQALEWSNIGTIKDLFIMPAPLHLQGDRIGWVSQLAMTEQVEFEGVWSSERLMLTHHHRGPHGQTSRQEDTFTFLAAEEVAKLKGEKGKRSRK